MERIIAHYYIETPLEMETAANVLAGEQSSGTFVPGPSETEALKQRFAARVESIKQFETVHEPAIPGTVSEKGINPIARVLKYKAYAPGSAVGGLEVSFTGGQVGCEDYLEMVSQGKSIFSAQ